MCACLRYLAAKHRGTSQDMAVTGLDYAFLLLLNSADNHPLTRAYFGGSIQLIQLTRQTGPGLVEIVESHAGSDTKVHRIFHQHTIPVLKPRSLHRGRTERAACMFRAAPVPAASLAEAAKKLLWVGSETRRRNHPECR